MPKVRLPKTVDGDTGHEWVFRPDQPAGEFQSVGGFLISGQTKDRLSSREVAAFISGVVKDAFSLWLNQHTEEAEKLAELQNIKVSELVDVTTKNFNKLFFDRLI